jgi:hypothetical protein
MCYDRDMDDPISGTGAAREARKSRWLPTVFWVVTGCESVYLIVTLVDSWISPGGGEFAGLAIFGLFVITCLLAVIMLIFALVRNVVVRVIALGLTVLPPLQIGIEQLGILVTTPREAALEAGHGYFNADADRALADAIVAGDVAAVAARAPAANLNAVGYGGMTFMRLALEQGQANPDVVAALLKAGLNPDQAQRMLFGNLSTLNSGEAMIAAKNEPLLRAVLDAGVNLNEPDREGYPRFFAGLKWPEGLALMLDRGANTEAEDKDGTTAIIWAVRLWYWPAIDVLLAHGSRLDHFDHAGHGVKDAVDEKLARFQNDRSEVPPQLAALAERLR